MILQNFVHNESQYQETFQELLDMEEKFLDDEGWKIFTGHSNIKKIYESYLDVVDIFVIRHQ